MKFMQKGWSTGLVVMAALIAAGCGGGHDGASQASRVVAMAPWTPAAAAVPASGNYVYLASEDGDTVGGGTSATSTHATGALSVSASGDRISVTVGGDTPWTGELQVPGAPAQIARGYHTGLARYTGAGTAGGVSWTTPGRTCTTVEGWFSVDSIGYMNGALAFVDLRFEQRCDGASASLHGKIHWTAEGVSTAGTSAVWPVPTGLWGLAADSAPAGNFVYLASDAREYIGQGQIYTYTPDNATLAVTEEAGLVKVVVSVGTDQWTGEFKAKDNFSHMPSGFFGGVTRYPFHVVSQGGLNWSGHGRGCNTLTGWFAVDNIVYSGTSLDDIAISRLDLRFKQYCEGMGRALVGQIHWVR